jgi:pimeloyl-ACP methyl ester carboxylesterase
VIPDAAPAVVATARGPVEYAVSGDGPAVLALHGAMGGWDQSLMLMKAVGEPGYRTIAVSRPGYLGTPLASGRSPEEQADLCAGLLDTLGVARVCAMAVSGGGPAAIHFALRHPERCWGLVLVSTCGGKVTERLPVAFHMLKYLGRFRWFTDSMRRRVANDPDAQARASIPDPELRERTLADPVAGPLFRELNSSTMDLIPQRLPGTLNDVRVTRSLDYRLEDIRVPTLVVHGGADRLVPFDQHGRASAGRIPGAELVTDSSGDHVFIYTHHALVQPRVAAFMKTHATPGRST